MKTPKNYFSSLFIVLVLLIFLVGLTYHLIIVSSPHPQELRENAVILSTKLMREGKNPYSLELMPMYANVYGLVYPVLALPFDFLIENTYIAHRLVSLLGILGCCLIVWSILLREKVDLVTRLFAVVIFYIQLITNGFDIVARPDSFGLLFYLLGFYCVLYVKNERKKLLLATIFFLSAFFTKPYFLLGIGLLVVYCLMEYGWLKGVVYSAAIGLITSIVIFVFSLFFETYLLNIFFIHVVVADKSLPHLINQLGLFSLINLWWMAVLILGLVIIVFKRKLLISTKLFFSRHLDRTVMLWMFAGIVCFVGKMGWHTGNFMTYLNHLVLPFFIVLGAVYCKKVIPAPRILTGIKYVNIAALLFYIVSKFLNVVFLLPATEKGWQEFELITRDSKVLMNPPASLISHRESTIVDTGATEYFRFGFIHPYASIVYSKQFLDQARAQDRSYREGIASAIENSEYDIVLFDYRSFEIMDRSKLEKNYRLDTTIPIITYQQLLETEVWRKI